MAERKAQIDASIFFTPGGMQQNAARVSSAAPARGPERSVVLAKFADGEVARDFIQKMATTIIAAGNSKTP